jgi:hypothetical protein
MRFQSWTRTKKQFSTENCWPKSRGRKEKLSLHELVQSFLPQLGHLEEGKIATTSLLFAQQILQGSTVPKSIKLPPSKPQAHSPAIIIVVIIIITT